MEFSLDLYDQMHNTVFKGVRKDDVILLSFIHHISSLYKFIKNPHVNSNKQFILNSMYANIPDEFITLNALAEFGLFLDSIQLLALCSLQRDIFIESRLGALVKAAAIIGRELNKKTGR